MVISTETSDLRGPFTILRVKIDFSVVKKARQTKPCNTAFSKYLLLQWNAQNPSIHTQAKKVRAMLAKMSQ